MCSLLECKGFTSHNFPPGLHLCHQQRFSSLWWNPSLHYHQQQPVCSKCLFSDMHLLSCPSWVPVNLAVTISDERRRERIPRTVWIDIVNYKNLWKKLITGSGNVGSRVTKCGKEESNMNKLAKNLRTQKTCSFSIALGQTDRLDGRRSLDDLDGNLRRASFHFCHVSGKSCSSKIKQLNAVPSFCQFQRPPKIVLGEPFHLVPLTIPCWGTTVIELRKEWGEFLVTSVIVAQGLVASWWPVCLPVHSVSCLTPSPDSNWVQSENGAKQMWCCSEGKDGHVRWLLWMERESKVLLGSNTVATQSTAEWTKDLGQKVSNIRWTKVKMIHKVTCMKMQEQVLQMQDREFVKLPSPLSQSRCL